MQVNVSRSWAELFVWQNSIKEILLALTVPIEILPVCKAVATKAPETPRFLKLNQIVYVSNSAANIDVNANFRDYFLKKINVYAFTAANPQPNPKQ